MIIILFELKFEINKMNSTKSHIADDMMDDENDAFDGK
jgi:serine/threonine-protein phosphatase PP1 catalytic subunit